MEVKNRYMTVPLTNAECKQEGDKGIVLGHASTFGNEDLGGDIVVQGAFSKTIKENPMVPVLADHDPRKQIGVTTTIREDNIGLFVEGSLDLSESKNGHPRNEKAAEKFSIAKMSLDLGAKIGLSIGFRTIKEEFDREADIRRLVELKLFEWSLVTFPMNTMAGVTGVKWAELSLENVIKDFVKETIKHGHKDTDVFKALVRAAEPHLSRAKLTQEFEASLQQLNSVMKG